MFKKIEIWIVGIIVLFFFLLILLVAGVSRDAYLGKNKTPEFLRNNVLALAEIPKNIYHVTNHILGNDINNPPKILTHRNKKRFKQFIKNKRNALLVLPRYDHELNRSIVDIIDLNNFEIIHTYKHDIKEMNDLVSNTEEFPRLKIDHSPIRFQYQHPLLFEDGSLIGIYSPVFKIDFCSNLEWINDEENFHHSQMLDHMGNIWIGGKMNPKSQYVNKNSIKGFSDDSIIKINIDGKILYNKSITEILIENSIIDSNFFNTINLDPIHLNDIEPAFSDTKYWKKGDVFISIRHQSAIIHYRPKTNKVINYIKGPFSQQHDVDIISDKEISIFNNNNFVINNKFSEILIYDFETKEFRKLFNEQLKREDFKTGTQGLSHIFKDGALMVEEQNHGRIILFDNNGKKEWEFVNKDKNGDIGYISWVRVIENKLFIEKFKTLVRNKKCLN